MAREAVNGRRLRLEHPRRWPDAQRWADGLASRRRRAELGRCRGGALTVLPHRF